MAIDLTEPGVLLRPDVLEDPRSLYDTLRHEAPLWRIPGQDSFIVSDPGLIRDIVARPAEFSSNLVSLLHRGPAGELEPFPIAPVGDPVHVLATADPPVHTRHRRLLQPHLSPGAVAELTPAISRIVDEHLTRLVDRGAGDAVAEFANPLPMRAICEVIGLPPDDASRLLPLVLDTGALLDGVTDLDGMSRAGAAAIELATYAQHRLDDALGDRSTPASGLLAVFVEGIDAGKISAAEARDILVVLINAGSETTSSLIAATIRELAGDPGLQDRLRGRPDLIPGVLEDVLRDDGPFQFHYRWVPATTTVGDTTIPAGSRIMLMWAAANRSSPEAPEQAGGTDDSGEHSGPAPHYAFGRGLHFCIGAHFARLEARIAIERLLSRTRGFSLDPDRPPRLRESIFLRRHASLPLIFREG